MGPSHPTELKTPMVLGPGFVVNLKPQLGFKERPANSYPPGIKSIPDPKMNRSSTRLEMVGGLSKGLGGRNPPNNAVDACGCPFSVKKRPS